MQKEANNHNIRNVVCDFACKPFCQTNKSKLDRAIRSCNGVAVSELTIKL